MMKIQRSLLKMGVIAALAASTGCVTNPDSSGLEYMPDMYRSPAIEAYVDYGQDPYQVGEDVASAQRQIQSARKPVAGTIPFSPEAMAFFFALCVSEYGRGIRRRRNKPLVAFGERRQG